MIVWSPIALSFQVALAATALSVAVGAALGLALSSPRTPWRDALDALCSAPLVLPPTVLGYYVLVALGRQSALGGAFERLTGSPVVFTRTGAVVAASLGALPLVVKSARTAFEGVDGALVDVARTLGAGPLRVFATVRLPLAARGLVAGAVLAFARSLGDFGLTLMVGGNIPGQTQTASLAIYDAIQAQREGDARAMIAVLTVAALASLYAVNKLGRAAHGR